MKTWDMSRTRSVWAANQPMVATVSYQTVLMASARARGMATWSHTLTLSNPAASHALATLAMSAGPASGSQGMRIKVDCACTGRIIPNFSDVMNTAPLPELVGVGVRPHDCREERCRERHAA